MIWYCRAHFFGQPQRIGPFPGLRVHAHIGPSDLELLKQRLLAIAVAIQLQLPFLFEGHAGDRVFVFIKLQEAGEVLVVDLLIAQIAVEAND
jgi:hypothetical protein